MEKFIEKLKSKIESAGLTADIYLERSVRSEIGANDGAIEKVQE